MLIYYHLCQRLQNATQLNQKEMPQILLPEQQRTGIGTKRI